MKKQAERRKEAIAKQRLDRESLVIDKAENEKRKKQNIKTIKRKQIDSLLNQMKQSTFK